MRDRNFIENKSALSIFRLSLLRTYKKSILDNPLFRHIWTGQLWERYQYDKIEHLRISGYGFRTYPHPETFELIEIALFSKIDEEIIGACRLLFRLEFIGIGYRDELVNRMEQDIKKISEKRFALIFELAQLANQGNLRDVMYKADEEINADLEFYQDLGKRALALKKGIATAQNIIA